MLLIKLTSLWNKENITTFFTPLLTKKNIKYSKFNQALNYCTHSKNEIKMSFKIKMKAKGLVEIWKVISWQVITITANFWREFPLSSIKNSKSISVYEFNFLNLLQKSIFVKYATIIPWIFKLFYINFDTYFFVFFNISLNMPSRFLSLKFLLHFIISFYLE